MGISVLVTRDFEHMSEVAERIVSDGIIEILSAKKECVLGLATGNSPTGLYKKLARSGNSGRYNPSRIQSFNLDEYVGLPGDNPQQRVMHPESYCFFMIREFFGLLKKNFSLTSLPCASLIDQERLIRELAAHPEDWMEEGFDAGRAISIKPDAFSPYLAWIRDSVLTTYERKIKDAGGIDLQIIGVGGRGHVGFHESGIPFDGSRVMLVKLDDNTVENAVADGHFQSAADSPRYAVTMGAELVYRASTVVLLASGERKRLPVARSLLEEPTTEIPISYGQIYARNGGRLVYIVDRAAGRMLLELKETAGCRGIEIREVG